jgi:uncharacterized membrane protein YhaH (DUF805 family)
MLAHIGFVLFSFEGRIKRGAFIGGSVFWFVLMIVLMAIGKDLDAAAHNPQYLHEIGNFRYVASPIEELPILFFALLCVPLQIKRWHDCGRSAWWVLLWLVPIISLLQLIGLCFVPGTDGENEWGPDPSRCDGSILSSRSSEFSMRAYSQPLVSPSRGPGLQKSVSAFEKHEPSFARQELPVLDVDAAAAYAIMSPLVEEDGKQWPRQAALPASPSWLPRNIVLSCCVLAPALAAVLYFLPMFLPSLSTPVTISSPSSEDQAKREQAAQAISDLINSETSSDDGQSAVLPNAALTSNGVSSEGPFSSVLGYEDYEMKVATLSRNSPELKIAEERNPSGVNRMTIGYTITVYGKLCDAAGAVFSQNILDEARSLTIAAESDIDDDDAAQQDFALITLLAHGMIGDAPSQERCQELQSNVEQELNAMGSSAAPTESDKPF